VGEITGTSFLMKISVPRQGRFLIIKKMFEYNFILRKEL
jgi:hypothetical protein